MGLHVLPQILSTEYKRLRPHRDITYNIIQQAQPVYNSKHSGTREDEIFARQLESL